MSQANILAFMDRFHTFERTLQLFESRVEGDLWWDAVRYDACRFLFDCLTGLRFSLAHLSRPRPRKLGVLRRWSYRRLLFARAQIHPKDFLVIRAARNLVEGQLHDVALDPVTALFPSSTLTINTTPRRYHLPEFDPSLRPGKVPPALPEIIGVLLKEFGIEPSCAGPLDTLIRLRRAEYIAQVAGYHDLFARTHPKAVLLVQNGIEKALFHVAKTRGVPTIEAQHGLINHGHPAYSYPRGVDYSRQTGLPDLFLTFSDFWQSNVFYPAGRQIVIGNDHFAADVAPVREPLGTVMVISANIYHRELLELTRQVAARLPGRKFVYKLHPNQKSDESDIRASLADLPNVEVGDPATSASRLMANVSHLVAIQSTVVYEALQHGRRVCIIPRHNFNIHADIFGRPQVVVSDTVARLAAAVETPCERAKGPTYFEKFDPQRAVDLLAPFAA
jgi:hypothetical protein